jgi:hypothetical protein
MEFVRRTLTFALLTAQQKSLLFAVQLQSQQKLTVSIFIKNRSSSIIAPESFDFSKDSIGTLITNQYRFRYAQLDFMVALMCFI